MAAHFDSGSAYFLFPGLSGSVQCGIELVMGTLFHCTRPPQATHMIDIVKKKMSKWAPPEKSRARAAYTNQNCVLIK
jgi:hypothetical protein